MLASPGCWAAYGAFLSGGLQGSTSGPLAMPQAALTVDAYAVQHPGVPAPQATQSVWVHLITLHLVLEGGWAPSQAIRLRTIGADASAGWAWLEPPGSMGPVTAIDVVHADELDRSTTVRAWVDGAWAAWSVHHPAVRATAADLVRRLD